MIVSACNGSAGKDVGSSIRGGSAVAKSTDNVPLRDKPELKPYAGPKRNSKVNIPDAFRSNEGPPIDKPKPTSPKPVLAPKSTSDANNNASSSSVLKSPVGKLDKSKFERLSSDASSSDTPKFGGAKVSPRDNAGKKADGSEKQNSPRGIGIKLVDTSGPIDFKSRLKPVGTVKPGVSSKPVSKSQNDLVELRSPKTKGGGEKRKSVIRKFDMKKFHRVDPHTLQGSGAVPDKPEKVDFDLDLEALSEDFIKAIETIDETSKKDHGWTEVEELYDDCGNVVRPITSRVVSLIPDMTEEDEKMWNDAGFPGLSNANDELPPPPAELLEEEQETYDDVALQAKPPDDDDDDGELYEALPDEPFDEEVPPPPPVGPKPPEPPSTPHPKSHTEQVDTVSEGTPDTTYSLDKAKEKEAKEAEKERKKREKEEEKKRKNQEKELKKLAKNFGISDPAQLATTVGKGRIKVTAKAKKKNEIAVTEGDEVDIIRMIDNPTGKWLIRILSSQKLGYCDQSNVEFMTGSGKKNSTVEDPDGPQEVYEDVEGEAEDLIEDEIYEECH